MSLTSLTVLPANSSVGFLILMVAVVVWVIRHDIKKEKHERTFK